MLAAQRDVTFLEFKRSDPQEQSIESPEEKIKNLTEVNVKESELTERISLHLSQLEKLQSNLKSALKYLKKKSIECESKKTTAYSPAAFNIAFSKKTSLDMRDFNESDEAIVSEWIKKYEAQRRQLDKEIKAAGIQTQAFYFQHLVEKKSQEQIIDEMEKLEKEQEVVIRSRVIDAMQSAAQKYFDFLKKKKQKEGPHTIRSQFGSIVTFASTKEIIEQSDILDCKQGSGQGLSFLLSQHPVKTDSVLFSKEDILKNNTLDELLAHFNHLMFLCAKQSGYSLFSRSWRFLNEEMNQLISQNPHYFVCENKRIRLKSRIITPKKKFAQLTIEELNKDTEEKINLEINKGLEKCTENTHAFVEKINDHVTLMEQLSKTLIQEATERSACVADMYHSMLASVDHAREALNNAKSKLDQFEKDYQIFFRTIQLKEKIENLDLLNHINESLNKKLKQVNECFELYKRAIRDNVAMQQLEENILAFNNQYGSKMLSDYPAKLQALKEKYNELSLLYEPLQQEMTVKHKSISVLGKLYRLSFINQQISVSTQKISRIKAQLHENANHIIEILNNFGKNSEVNAKEQANEFLQLIKENMELIEKEIELQKKLFEYADKIKHKVKRKKNRAAYAIHSFIFQQIEAQCRANLKIQNKTQKHFEEIKAHYKMIGKYQKIVEEKKAVQAALAKAVEEQNAFDVQAKCLEANFIQLDEEVFSQMKEGATLQAIIKNELRVITQFESEFHYFSAKKQHEFICQDMRTLRENKQNNSAFDRYVTPSILEVAAEYHAFEEKLMARRTQLKKLKGMKKNINHYKQISSHYKAIHGANEEYYHLFEQFTACEVKINKCMKNIDLNLQDGAFDRVPDFQKRIEKAATEADALKIKMKQQHPILFHNYHRMQQECIGLLDAKQDESSPLLTKALTLCKTVEASLQKVQTKANLFENAIQEAKRKAEDALQAKLKRETAIQIINFIYEAIMGNLAFWASEVKGGGGVPIQGLDKKEYRIAAGLKKIVDQCVLFRQNQNNQNPLLIIEKLGAESADRILFGNTCWKYCIFNVRYDSVHRFYECTKDLTPDHLNFDLLYTSIKQIKNSKNQSLILEPANLSLEVGHASVL